MSTGRYNSTHRHMRTLWPIVLLCLPMVITPGRLSAQAADRWAAPAAELSRQIGSLAGPGPATLAIQNASAIPADAVPSIRRMLETGLKASGIPVRAAAEAAAIPTAIRVTLSQTATSGLWVAEVQQGAEVRVAMVPLVLETAHAVEPSAAITLHKRLLFSAAEPILDGQLLVGDTDPATPLVVLTPARIAIYHQSAGQWQQVQSFAIEAAAALPRDARGEIVTSSDTVSAYLPGMLCDGVPSESQLAFSCRASDDPWPVGSQRAVFNGSRNFFSGVLVPASAAALTPFYSAAEVPRAGGPVLVFSDVRGRVRMLDRGAEVDLTGSRDWGSDLASVHSGCGSGTQLLADAAGDPAADSIRAYEINGREASAVSAPLPFDGTITAMRPAGENDAVIVIVRVPVPQSSRYEVWRVTLDCH